MVIVQRIEGEPGDSLFGSPALYALRPPLACRRLAGCSYPCREQRGLPTTGRGRDERQRVRACRIQFSEQARSVDEEERAWWRVALPSVPTTALSAVGQEGQARSSC